ncbi:MarR family winged helix-turn-helix transcriptional regulator [Pusillimonas sp.]|uniref:MarR family winged helix-turn-helix transcriptional regulator n=1 Tax=Pusillimonas sp. TaxID=3040095 RepID=UPI0029A8923E|nr:MarR family transcriptional regulator [Pusillimonas sp.]MDX3893440.1 MarR family transcriptional regulator [Pusillimonas sp.]
MDTRKDIAVDRRDWRDAIPQDRLAHLLKDARRAMERALQIRLIDHSVSFGHWTFLRILWEHDGLTQRELSESAGMTAPTTFAAINAMESLGYVSRRQRSGNRKNVYVYLTATGRALKDKLLPLAEEVNAIAINELELDEVLVARKVLLKITANLNAYEKDLLESENRRVPSTRQLGRLYSA